MPTQARFPRWSRLLPALLVSTLAQVACDAPDAAQPGRSHDLSRFGIAEVVAAPAQPDAYLLLDGKGNDIGRIEHTLDGDEGAVTIELDGERSQLRWSEHDASLQCEGTSAMPTGDGRPRPAELTDDCMDALFAASQVAEADGLDVPGYTLPEADSSMELRSACEVVNMWDDTCSACYSKAFNASVYSGHAGGTCTAGWFTVSCSHTFCGGGGAQLEMQVH
jgi:hypothetical protein